jgi:TP901 family phage tail tape measure protein
MADQESKARIVVEVEDSQLNDFIRTLGLAEQEAEGSGRAFRSMSKDAIALNKGNQGASKATQALNASVSATTASLPRLRYALYDVSQSVAVVSLAMVALAAAPFAVAISWERAFADVRRTTDGTAPQLSALNAEFVKLAQTIPLSFKGLTEIGSLAGQLDVPINDVAEFTELVAKFSATTDVSIDASATAFARLTTLLEPLEGGYNALGSSILKVGVNSIATESQIISISTQIAGVAAQAGLSADEVFGLSAAIASVGIQPELARGTITRLFGEIGRAVSTGGTALQDFGAISGKSGEEFARAWETAPMEALLGVLDGIGNRSGPDAEKALRDLGITSVRDVPAILRLAQNTDLLRSNLSDAATGAAEGSELNRQYGIVANTVAEKLTLLNNNFQALLATTGDSATSIGWVIDGLNGMLQEITAIAADPFWSVIVGGSVALVGLAGILGLLVAAAIRTTASMAALATAQAELNITTLGLRGSMAALIPQILGSGASATTATAAIRGLSVAMRALTVVGVALIAVEAATGLAEWGREALGASDSVENLTQKLGEASEAGTDFGEVFSSANVGGDPLGLGKLVSGNNLAGVDNVLAAGASFGSDLQKSIYDGFGYGLTTQGLLDNILGIGPGQNFDELDKIDEALASLVSGGNMAEALAGFDSLMSRATELGLDTEQLASTFTKFNTALGESGVAGARSALAAEANAAATEDFAASLEATSAAMAELVDDVFGGVNAARQINDELAALGGTLFDVGAQSAFTSDDFQSLISTIIDQSGGASAAAGNLQGLFNSLVQGGYASAEQLGYLNQVIAQLVSLSGQAAPTASFFDISALATGFDGASVAAQKTASSTRSVAKEVRTLLDYASDLSGVFERAFDIRFGSQLSIDSVTSSWRDLNDEMDDYRRKVNELTADRAVKQYFLSIAESYGDTLRAGVLRSELEGIDSDLAEATAGVSTELNGNSKAAIENRKRITDLVSGYQDYITKLASSGASQDVLNAAVAQSKNDFLAQATALGYSTAQLQPYVAGFEDMAVAIGRIPRNITVDINTDPAEQALKEFFAKVKSTGAGGYGGGVTVPVRVDTSSVSSDFAKVARGAKILDLYNKALKSGADNVAIRYLNQLNSGNYYDGGHVGGYTGNGGKYQPKGVVHGGEFVFTKEATQRAGVGNLYGMMNAFERGRGMYSGGAVTPTVRTSSGGGNSGPTIVHLSPEDRALLARAGDVRLYLDGKEVAQAGYQNTLTAANRGTN